MPTDLERQLPRFAEALDRDAPAISVDEIYRGTGVVDVHGLERSLGGHVPRIDGVSGTGDTVGHDGDAERDASMPLEPTTVEPPARRRVALSVALGAAAVTVLVVAFAAVVRIGEEPEPADVPTPTIPAPTIPGPTIPAPAPTIPAPAPSIPVDAFVGVWRSTDTDGSHQTMEIARSGTDGYQVVIRDEAASAACGGGAATLSGIGRLTTDSSLVLPTPELTCDDGTTPSMGPPPQAELADFTLELATEIDELVDDFGIMWQREGSEVDRVGRATSDPTSGGMWPQPTLEEVRAAQESVDAGDPAHMWQVDPNLIEEIVFTEDDEVEYAIDSPGKLVDRFLREVLGWEAYLRLPGEGTARNGTYTELANQRYLRCMPGRTNPLYPPDDRPELGEGCAPTIDDFNYESVSLDLAQPARQGAGGVWVVDRWRRTEPFAQADPAVVEARARKPLEQFLAARIAGEEAEGLVELDDGVVEVPLLYATTAGVPYERYEIERVDGPQWPGGGITFSARMYAEGDAAVVEQEFWALGDWLRMDDDATIENGQSLVVSHTSTDGELTVSAPSAWQVWLPGRGAGNGGHEQALDVWFGGLWRSEEFFGSGERIEFVDPVAYDAWCAANGGSPLLSAPAGANAIAQQLIGDRNFETTTPVAARVGGVDAVAVDVALAPGGRDCGVGMIEISRWIHAVEPGWRLRLYLVDLPEGMSVETLAITVVAPEDRFDEVIAETAPIIESIEFRPG